MYERTVYRYGRIKCRNIQPIRCFHFASHDFVFILTVSSIHGINTHEEKHSFLGGAEYNRFRICVYEDNISHSFLVEAQNEYSFGDEETRKRSFKCGFVHSNDSIQRNV